MKMTIKTMIERLKWSVEYDMLQLKTEMDRAAVSPYLAPPPSAYTGYGGVVAGCFALQYADPIYAMSKRNEAVFILHRYRRS